MGSSCYVKECDKKGLTLDQRLEAWREHKRLVKVHRLSTHNWERAVANQAYRKYGLKLGMLIVQLRHLQKKIMEKKRELRQHD